jgi:hypothetical protein
MPTSRAGYDILFDRIKEALAKHADTEAQTDVSLGFDVYAEYARIMPPNKMGAYVVLFLGSLEPEARRSAARVHFGYTVNYSIECYALGKRTPGSHDTRGDEAAGMRLLHLVHQVLTALYLPENTDFGFKPGVIAARPSARVEMFLPPEQHTERVIAAARVNLDVGISWDPARATGPELEEIAVDAGRFSALYGYA